MKVVCLLTKGANGALAGIDLTKHVCYSRFDLGDLLRTNKLACFSLKTNKKQTILRLKSN